MIRTHYSAPLSEPSEKLSRLSRLSAFHPRDLYLNHCASLGDFFFLMGIVCVDTWSYAACQFCILVFGLVLRHSSFQMLMIWKICIDVLCMLLWPGYSLIKIFVSFGCIALYHMWYVEDLTGVTVDDSMLDPMCV